MTEKMSKIKLTTYESEGGQLVFFSRGDNDMIIGAVQNGDARFGEDPDQQHHRCFTSHEAAMEYIKTKCRDYLGREDVDFLVFPGQPLVRSASAMPKRRM